MKFTRLSIILFLFGALSFTFFSCSKSNESPSATVSFSTATATYGEDAGTVNLTVALSAKQTTDVVVNYTWASADTSALLGGDFTFATPTPITIAAGQTTGVITLDIIDDTLIDGDDSLQLTLNTVTAGTAIVGTNNKLNLSIVDNDVNTNSASNLHVDLEWFVGSNPLASITGIRMDVVLASDVVLDTAANSLTWTTYSTTEKDPAGFVSLDIPSTVADDTYYILVLYTSGTGTANYKITLDGWGFGHQSDTFDLLAANYLYPYGPFTKSGSTFEFTGRSSSDANSLKNFKMLRKPLSKF